MLLVVLTEILTSSLRLQLETQAVSTVEQDGRYILNRFIYDIHRAKSISIPASLGETNKTDHMTVNIGGTNYSYQMNGENLEFTDGLTNYLLNSGDTTVSQLFFTRIGEGNDLDTVRIYFQLRGTTIPKSGPEVKTFQTTVGLRCYSTNCL